MQQEEHFRLLLVVSRSLHDGMLTGVLAVHRAVCLCGCTIRLKPIAYPKGEVYRMDTYSDHWDPWI